MPLIIIGIIFITGLFIFYLFSTGSGNNHDSKKKSDSSSDEDKTTPLFQHKNISHNSENFEEETKENNNDN